MTVQPKPLVEITQDAIRILCREIGVVDTIRFLNQFTTGYGNYTEERQARFDDLSVEEIVAEIRRDREATLQKNNESA